MAIVFKTPKSTLNTTSKQIQNLGGDCPPCPEPVLEGKELEYTQNGEYTVTPEQGVDGFSSIDVTVNIPSDVNNQNKTVSPSTSSQTVEADSGYSGLGTVTVDAVTSAIDQNIAAGNIKKDVTILGVTGSYDPQPNLSNLNITPSTNAQEYNPAISGVDGYSLVSVSAVTSAIDQNIAAGNIRDGVSILGVTGNYSGASINNQNKTVSPSTSQQSVSADQGYTGLGTVTVNAVTSSIDQNIAAGNIKSGVSILGVTGNYDPQPDLQAKTVNPSTSQQTVTPDQGKDGLSSVTVTAVTNAIDANIQAGNIKNGVSILGVTGSYDPQPNLQSKSVNPTTSAQTVSPDSGYDGLSQVSVAAVTAAIDANIQAENILDGVTILGVTGSDLGYDAGYSDGYAQGQAECPEPGGECYTAYLQDTITTGGTYTYDPSDYQGESYDAFDGVEITVVDPSLQDDKVVTPSTIRQEITNDEGYYGLGTVTVNAVTSAIDQNIVAGNIRDGVTILGVLGTYSGAPVQADPFWIKSLEDGNTVTVKHSSDYMVNPVSLDLEYSLDGSTWTAITLQRNQGVNINLNTNDVVYFKGNNTTLCHLNDGTSEGIIHFKSTKTVNVGGYLSSILRDSDYANYSFEASYAFSQLFSYVSDVLQVVDASQLILPKATAAFCYNKMFENCTTLEVPPTLPSSVVARYAYNSMFKGCTSLRIAPAMPIRVIESYGCEQMFYGCTNLPGVPNFIAKDVREHSLSYMFYGCSSITSVPSNMLPSKSLAEHCYSHMFENCTSLTNAPELPATYIINHTYVYAYMFSGCTSLTTAPMLPAREVPSYGYSNMFYGCSSLSEITCLSTSASTGYAFRYSNWVQGVAATGTFYKNANMSSWETGASGIPSGWTVEDYVDPNAS